MIGRVEALYPSLAVAPFRRLWLGMVPAFFAFNMGVVATGYAAVTLSRSAFEVGLVGGAWGLPVLFVPLIGGVAADRYSRRLIMVATHAAIALASVTVALLALAGTLAIWHLVALGLVQGVAFSFMTPARVALTATILDEPLMPNAIGAHYVALNVSAMIAPVLAGIALAAPAVGIGGTYLVIVGLLALAVTILSRLPSDAGGAVGDGPAWDRMVEGLGYIARTRTLQALIGLAALVMFMGMPYQQLLPVFAERVHAAGATGLGLLVAATGVGAVAGSLATAPLKRQDRLVGWQLVFGVGFGLSLVAFGIAPVFAAALGAAAVAGFTSAALVVVNNSLVIARADQRLIGRVWSINQVTFGLGLVGAVPMAWLADRIGPGAAVALGGLLVAAATIVASRLVGRAGVGRKPAVIESVGESPVVTTKGGSR